MDQKENDVVTTSEPANIESPVETMSVETAPGKQAGMEATPKQPAKGKNKIGILILIVVVLIAAVIGGMQYMKSSNYKKADECYKKGDYQEAMETCQKLGNYKDSADLLLKSKYKYALELEEDKLYDDALVLFNELGDYRNTKGEIIDCYCGNARNEIIAGNYDKAKEILKPIADESKAKHLLSVIDLKTNGIEALCTYLEENFEADSEGDYNNDKFIVKANGKSFKVWVIYESSTKTLRFDIERENKDKGEPWIIYHLGKDGKANYKLICSNTTKVTATYAYYNDSLYSDGEYCIGWIINALGKVDLFKFNKDSKVKIDKFNKLSAPESKVTQDEKDACANLMNGYTQIMLEGLQQFLNDKDLMCSIEELGFKGYKLKYVKPELE